MTGLIAFRPVSHADLALLQDWIARPHWQEWWGDPETEIGYIRDMLDGRDTTRPFLFTVDGLETGYIQHWTAGDQLSEPWLSLAPWLKDLPPDAVGIDLSIGDAAQLSRGLGSAVLKRFAERLKGAGHHDLIIDPDRNNARAIRAYEKAGFCAIPSLVGKTGDTLIMRYEG